MNYRQRGFQGGGIPPGAGGRQLVLPEPGDLGQIIVRGATNFARRHKVISGSYVLGIVVLLMFSTGAKLTYDQRREYNQIMSTIDLQAEYDASYDYWETQQAYRASKGWFTCDSLCQRNKRRMEDAKYRLDRIREEGQARMSDAKAVAGLFSEVGVGEVQDSFWEYFSSGKRFAKRQVRLSQCIIRRKTDAISGVFCFAFRHILNFLTILCSLFGHFFFPFIVYVGW